MMGFVRAAWARLIIYSINYPKRLALLAGAILPLGFAPFFYLPIYYLALAAFFALLWQTQNTTPHRVATQALIGFWFGFGQFFTGLIWIGEAFLVEAELFLWALPFAIILLPMGLALFVAAAAALSGWLVARFALPKMAALISYMLALSVADWGRAHLLTGFPWNQPEQAWSGFLPLAQNLALWGAAWHSFANYVKCGFAGDGASPHNGGGNVVADLFGTWRRGKIIFSPPCK